MFGSNRRNTHLDSRRGGEPPRPASAGTRGGPAPPSAVAAPLLLMPSNQSLTFAADDVQPGMFMPVPLQPQQQHQQQEQLFGNVADDLYEGEMDSFVGEAESRQVQSTQSSGPSPSGAPPLGAAPPPGPAVPPLASSSSVPGNMFRMSGRPRYAAPSDSSGSLNPTPAPPPPSSFSTPASMSPPTSIMSPDVVDYGAENINSSSNQIYPPPINQTYPQPSAANQMVSPPPVGGVDSGIPAQPAFSYIPITYHWFYCKNVGLRQLWLPLSIMDSSRLEAAYCQALAAGIFNNQPIVVRTDGDRFDVDLMSRTRRSVYWEEPETRVRRCSWFYRSDSDSHLVPYEEEFAELLEENYRTVLSSEEWRLRKMVGVAGDSVIIHSPYNMLHFLPSNFSSQNKTWMNSSTTYSGQEVPRVLKRGVEEMENIVEGESSQVDHVVFFVHGIGPTCDLRFRNIVDCINDMRVVADQMLSEHFLPNNSAERPGARYQTDTEYTDNAASPPPGGSEGGASGVTGGRRVNRIEFLPVSWHAALHGDATGIDRKLKSITLNSIGKLRQYTNDTLLDVLFYGSPAYAQKIADTVAGEINRLYQLFCSRNPDFTGGVSLAGHSLGSLILFDLLVNQKPYKQFSDVTSAGLVPVSSSASLHSASRSSSVQELAAINNQSDSPVAMIGAESNVKIIDDSELLSGSHTTEQILKELNLTEYIELFEREKIDADSLLMVEENDLKEMGLPLGPRKKILGFIRDHKERAQRRAEEKRLAVDVSVVTSDLPADERNPVLTSFSNTSVNFVVACSAGTGIPFVKYPQLDFYPTSFFALGSPVAMFLTVRGVNCLGPDFRLPTCPGFYNIFHPFDPVAYRMEPMVVQGFPLKPALMPHHRGRKRMHLELRDSLTRVGYDIKQRVVETVKSTWRTINDFALAYRTTQQLQQGDGGQGPSIEQEDSNDYGERLGVSGDENVNGAEIKSTSGATVTSEDDEYPTGCLNNGRRIDYVLQEKPIESFNDYLFALSSHACYWDSEDTVLMILKKIYLTLGVNPMKADTTDSEGAPHSTHTGPAPSPAFPRHPLTSRYGSKPPTSHTTPLSIYRNNSGPLRHAPQQGAGFPKSSGDPGVLQPPNSIPSPPMCTSHPPPPTQSYPPTFQSSFDNSVPVPFNPNEGLNPSYFVPESQEAVLQFGGDQLNQQAQPFPQQSEVQQSWNYHPDAQFTQQQQQQQHQTWQQPQSNTADQQQWQQGSVMEEVGGGGIEFSADALNSFSQDDDRVNENVASFSTNLPQVGQSQPQVGQGQSPVGFNQGQGENVSQGQVSVSPVPPSAPSPSQPSGPRASMGPPLAGRGRGMGPPLASRMGPPPGAASGPRPPVTGFVRK